ncbi:MAG: hypothetical protein A2744_02565 [Candidatus Buchananbacteria bacterium RIFCSPHIGHO2_01_FULL_44_11]|uniref:ParB-like N-terminal domain-containing protein n=1 Tax=Candidatus Buchananbacteria bacterium RIFCSPHIGHO2_01_FULL_44_11 TaxID=1797535 RepID=A0A1G1Y198_9BACT|nr:MAG: hypothetical protein A2744_02565 [Candidatus Buchananbacteria bacterium RIFCSPHIGHO2_01_FULL_44_11]
MKENQGLGRGLSSLIPVKNRQDILPKNSEVLAGQEMVFSLPVEKIKANPMQPRSDFDHQGLEDLTNSIKEHGILQPLIVTQTEVGYQLIAGERRLRAAQILGLKTVPAIIREAKDQKKLELALVENLQRQDLNVVEEAVAFQRLVDEFNLTQEAVAKIVGKSRSAVTNTLRLLTLPTEIQKALITGQINYSAARVILGLPPEKRLTFFKKVLKNDLTVRAVEGQVQKIVVKRHFRRSKDATLSVQEESLQRALGTKVNIKKSGQTGQIIIDFYSAEELNALLKKFGVELD